MVSADDLPGHTYLRENRPEWSKGLPTIKTQGGPWPCKSCGTASFLSYRCSKCGADLTDSGSASQ